ncbi:hypothetical protein TNCV_2048651 [Trichonephila clavipes]|nr:hypothetical protein TNCV_2048651 [Trichonephila clavipes]
MGQLPFRMRIFEYPEGILLNLEEDLDSSSLAAFASSTVYSAWTADVPICLRENSSADLTSSRAVVLKKVPKAPQESPVLFRGSVEN